jgi:hypothetical protein
MEQLNRYYRRSKISERKFRQLVRYLALDLTASKTAQLTALTRKTVTSIFLKIRERIAQECLRASHSRPVRLKLMNLTSVRVACAAREVAAHRVRPSSSASSKGMAASIRRSCRTAKKRTLQAIIRGRVGLDAVLNSDGWRGYDGLVDVGYSKHLRVNHGENEFVRDTAHVHGIESFWSFAKRRLLQVQSATQKLVSRVTQVT